MLRIVAKSASLCQMAALSAALLLVPPQASAENEKSNDFMVQYDQVRLMRIDEPASDIIVGNPSIADVAIQGSKLLVVTGKTFGVTNVIVLNGSGQVIANRRLVVRADDQKIVDLSRGTQKWSYNCAPKCQSVLKIGDESAYYQNVAKSSQDKLKIADKVVEGDAGAQ